MPDSTRIKDLPETERPREKLVSRGARTLSDAELLALFFRSGCRGMSAVEMGDRLVKKYGSLHAISRCSVEELAKNNAGIGPAKATELVAVFEMGSRLAEQRLTRSRIDNPEAVYELLAPEMQRLHRESLRVILLDTRYRLIKVEEVSLGSLNESVAHPREILRPAVIHSAYAFILVHNHPSGDPSPSAADRRLTRDVHEASEMLKIEMLDHVIIGMPDSEHEPFFSFREMGML